MTKRYEVLMGREVSKVASQFSIALGCSACGVGKAIDVVGRRWSAPPYDWAGAEAKRNGQHICPNTTWNLTEKPTRPIGAWEWASGKSFVGVPMPGSGIQIADAEKSRRVNEIHAQLEEWAKYNTELPLDGSAVQAPDPRLPPERDEEFAS